jgi:hypothetical protein
MNVRSKWLSISLLHVFAFAATGSVLGGTIAHWDFENELINGSPVDGTVVPHPSATGAHDDSIPDISGNGNHLSAFAQNGSFTEMRFSNVVAPNNQTGSTLSATNAPVCCPVLSSQDDLELGGVNVGALAAWTIEASVNLRNLGGWRTIVGKDGVGQATNGDPNQAPLYLQKVGDGTQRFRINFVDVQGYVHIADSTTVAVANQWYHLVASSDGNTLKLYVNGVLEGSLDMTLSPSTDRSMVALDESGFEGSGTVAPYAWSLFRGMYNDGHGDRVDGYIDDVRISDMALSPSEFLQVPEPGSIVLFVLGITLAAVLRRQ